MHAIETLRVSSNIVKNFNFILIGGGEDITKSSELFESCAKCRLSAILWPGSWDLPVLSPDQPEFRGTYGELATTELVNMCIHKASI